MILNKKGIKDMDDYHITGGAKPNIKWYKKIYHFWLFSLLMI